MKELTTSRGYTYNPDVAPLPAVLDVIRIALVATLDSDTACVNRFYMDRVVAGTAPANLNTMCAGIATDWGTDMKALFGTPYTLTSVQAEDLSSSTSPVGISAASIVGTRSGTRISASSCAIVQCKIGRRYRGGHPRVYLAAGTTSDLTTEQQWSAAFQTAVVNGWTAFMTHVQGRVNTAYGLSGTVPQCNVSYYQGFHNVTYPSGRTYPRPTLRVTPVVDDVIGYSINAHVGSQRRRNLTP